MTFCVSASTGAGISVMYHLQCPWYYVMLMPMASPDKSHVATHFDHVDPRNARMPLGIM